MKWVGGGGVERHPADPNAFTLPDRIGHTADVVAVFGVPDLVEPEGGRIWLGLAGTAPEFVQMCERAASFVCWIRHGDPLFITLASRWHEAHDAGRLCVLDGEPPG